MNVQEQTTFALALVEDVRRRAIARAVEWSVHNQSVPLADLSSEDEEYIWTVSSAQVLAIETRRTAQDLRWLLARGYGETFSGAECLN